MPKINTYTNASPILGSDKLIGTDANQSNMTKNFLLSDLAAYFSGNVTLDQVLANNNTSATRSIVLSNGGIEAATGYFINGLTSEGYIEISDALRDSSGYSGASGDVLVSAGSSVQWKTLSRGSFYSTQNQAVGAINTATPMTLNNTDSSVTNGVSVVSTSRITVTNTGIYNLQFSAQLDRVSGSGTDTVDIWFRKNGVDIPNSNTKVNMTGNANATKVAAAWNFMSSLVAGDYLEIIWASTSTNIQIIYEAATAPHPATPSLIATINKIA